MLPHEGLVKRLLLKKVEVSKGMVSYKTPVSPTKYDGELKGGLLSDMACVLGQIVVEHYI